MFEGKQGMVLLIGLVLMFIQLWYGGQLKDIYDGIYFYSAGATVYNAPTTNTTTQPAKKNANQNIQNWNTGVPGIA